jgi:hypothetical protein
LQKDRQFLDLGYVIGRVEASQFALATFGGVERREKWLPK